MNRDAYLGGMFLSWHHPPPVPTESGGSNQWIPILISGAALTVAVLTYWSNAKKTTRESAQIKVDTFMTLHRELVSSDIQAGRETLMSLSTTDDFARLRERDREKWNSVGRAVGMFDVLALHWERKLIDEDLVFSEWQGVLKRDKDQILAFIETRTDGNTVWPHLKNLLTKAAP